MSILGLHVARIRSGLEAECANQVGGFVPLKRDKWISRGKQREALRAQMPGYIFVELDITDPVAWHKVAEGKGFSHFLPGQTTLAELERIKATLDLEGVYVEPKAEQSLGLKRGDRVQITSGPLVGNYVTFLEESDNGKIFVEGYLLGTMTRLYMEAASISSSEDKNVPSDFSRKKAPPSKRKRGRRGGSSVRRSKPFLNAS